MERPAAVRPRAHASEIEELRAQAAELLASLSPAYGLRTVPELRIGPTIIGHCERRRRLRDGYIVTIEDDPRIDGEILRGVVAHELAHIACGDVARRRILRAITPALMPALVLALVLITLAAVLRPTILLWLTPALVVLPISSVSAWRWSPWFTDFQVANQWREIRADLVAVRMVGHGPVLAALQHAEATGVDVGDYRLPTHPPTSLKIATVQTYDARADPEHAARAAMARTAS